MCTQKCKSFVHLLTIFHSKPSWYVQKKCCSHVKELWLSEFIKCHSRLKLEIFVMQGWSSESRNASISWPHPDQGGYHVAACNMKVFQERGIVYRNKGSGGNSKLRTRVFEESRGWWSIKEIITRGWASDWCSPSQRDSWRSFMLKAARGQKNNQWISNMFLWNSLL